MQRHRREERFAEQQLPPAEVGGRVLARHHRVLVVDGDAAVALWHPEQRARQQLQRRVRRQPRKLEPREDETVVPRAARGLVRVQQQMHAVIIVQLAQHAQLRAEHGTNVSRGRHHVSQHALLRCSRLRQLL
eukprot:583461-Pleurochrysis_carterae.AAC.1